MHILCQLWCPGPKPPASKRFPVVTENTITIPDKNSICSYTYEFEKVFIGGSECEQDPGLADHFANSVELMQNGTDILIVTCGQGGAGKSEALGFNSEFGALSAFDALWLTGSVQVSCFDLNQDQIEDLLLAPEDEVRPRDSAAANSSDLGESDCLSIRLRSLKTQEVDSLLQLQELLSAIQGGRESDDTSSPRSVHGHRILIVKSRSGSHLVLCDVSSVDSDGCNSMYTGTPPLAYLLAHLGDHLDPDTSQLPHLIEALRQSMNNCVEVHVVGCLSYGQLLESQATRMLDLLTWIDGRSTLPQKIRDDRELSHPSSPSSGSAVSVPYSGTVGPLKSKWWRERFVETVEAVDYTQETTLVQESDSDIRGAISQLVEHVETAELRSVVGRLIRLRASTHQRARHYEQILQIDHARPSSSSSSCDSGRELSSLEPSPKSEYIVKRLAENDQRLERRYLAILDEVHA